MFQKQAWEPPQRIIYLARRITLCVLSLIVAQVTVNLAGADESLLIKPPGQSLDAFAAKIIPMDMRLAHRVVNGTIGPLRNCAVILLQAEKYGAFTGWVLVPEGYGYRKHVLPPVALPVSTDVKAVFFANADPDQDRELMVLAQHISGIGRYPFNIKPFCNSYPFDWNGNNFVYLENVGADLDRCTAKGVRRQLALKGYSQVKQQSQEAGRLPLPP